MRCTYCGSEKVVSVSAKCSDLFSVSFDGTEYDGYPLCGLGIGGGTDYVEFDFCLICGRIQGDFPKEIPEELLRKEEKE